MTEQVLALSNATAASMDRNLEKMSTAAGQVDGLDELVAESQSAFQDRMLSHLAERVGRVARRGRGGRRVRGAGVVPRSSAGREARRPGGGGGSGRAALRGGAAVRVAVGEGA